MAILVVELMTLDETEAYDVLRSHLMDVQISRLGSRISYLITEPGYSDRGLEIEFRDAVFVEAVFCAEGCLGVDFVFPGGVGFGMGSKEISDRLCGGTDDGGAMRLTHQGRDGGLLVERYVSDSLLEIVMGYDVSSGGLIEITITNAAEPRWD